MRRRCRRGSVSPVPDRPVVGRCLYGRPNGRLFALLGRRSLLCRQYPSPWLVAGFAGPNWSLTPSTGVPVKLQFDSGPPLEIAATIADQQLLLVPMPDDSHLIDTFWHSTKIAVVTQQHSFSLSLAAPAGLNSELTNCVHHSIALDTPAQLARTFLAPHTPELEEIKFARKFRRS